MYVSTHLRRRSLAALGLAALLTPLAGCQNRKYVARVNDATITDEEYQDYVSRVKAQDFQQLTSQQVTTDAGGAGLILAVKDKLLEKLAADKHALPTEDEVKRYAQYLTRTDPRVMSSIAAGQLTPEMLPKLLRENMIKINLGSNAATIPEADIQTAFKENQKQYNYPEIVGLRVAPVPNDTEGIQLISQIKANGDFAAAAAKYVPNAGAVRYVVLDPLPEPLKTALASLKDGQVAAAPVKIQAPGAPTATTIVVQLVKRMPKGDATLADAHEAVRERKLAETQPQLLQHSEELINEYNKTAKVDVYIERYNDVVKQALKPPVNPMGMMGGGPGGPGGAPSGGPGGAPSGAPGGGRPMMIRPGAGAPSGSAPRMVAPGSGSAPAGAGGAAGAGSTGSNPNSGSGAAGAGSSGSGSAGAGSGASGSTGASAPASSGSAAPTSGGASAPAGGGTSAPGSGGATPPASSGR